MINPANGEIIARTPLCGAEEVNAAAQAAAEALPAWRRTPAQDRIQYLFKLRDLLKANMDDLARTITIEAGKTYDEAKGEMVRAIENVEVACGIPMMMKGEVAEDIAPGIDEMMLRQPVGVCATICPFNFPGMIAFWYLPYAIACGNTYIIKPSEKVPHDHAVHLPAHRSDWPAEGRDQHGQRRKRCRGCHPRSSQHPGDHLCWLLAGGTLHLSARRRAGKARPGAGWGQEPGDHHAGCRYGNGDQDCGRLCLWLRRAALPGRLLGGDGGPGAQSISWR